MQVFFKDNGAKFFTDEKPFITERLSRLDDSSFIAVTTAGYKNPKAITAVSVFLGFLGIDRFLLGDVVAGICKLLTAGGCGIWWIIDWFLVAPLTKQKNSDKFAEVYSAQRLLPAGYQPPVPVYEADPQIAPLNMTATVETPAPAPSVPKAASFDDSSMEAMRKYKQLLDEGIITQDEFDSKKKEILGI